MLDLYRVHTIPSPDSFSDSRSRSDPDLAAQKKLDQDPDLTDPGPKWIQHHTSHYHIRNAYPHQNFISVTKLGATET